MNNARTCTLIMFLVLLFTGIVTFGLVRNPSDDLQKANAFFDEHTYKQALELYEKVLKENPDHPQAAEIELKICICLDKLDEFDKAIECLKSYLAKYTEDIWQARAYHLLGTIQFRMPHYYYEKEGEISRGKWIQGSQYHWTHEEDIKNSIENLEKSKSIYDAMMEQRALLAPDIDSVIITEVIQLNFDMIAPLQSRAFDYSHIYPEDETYFDKQKELLASGGKEYNPDLQAVFKILYLYNEIPRIDDSPDKHNSSQALYEKAMFLKQVEEYSTYYRDPKFKLLELIPKEEKVTTALKQVVAHYPKDEIADDAQLALALYSMQKNDFVEAVAGFNALLELFPKSKYTSDARYYIQEITYERLSMSAKVQTPAAKAKISLSCRNLKTIEFTAYAVDLEKIIIGKGYLKSPDKLFSQVWNVSDYYGEKVASWTFDTDDDGSHKYFNQEITTPLDSVGAYIIEAKSGPASANMFLIISDLALIEKTASDGAYVYIADVATGVPTSGVTAYIKEVYWDNRGNKKVHYQRVVTDEKGLAKKSAIKEGTSRQFEVFACKDSHYIASGLEYVYRGYGEEDSYRIYCETDRPVYRPNNDVNFKAILRLYKGGAYSNVTGKRVTVRINDTKGDEVYKSTLITDDFGTINGSFTLAEEPPLGMYYIRFDVEDAPYSVQYAGNQFRVEEYKKPEFEVTVTPDPPQVKLGSAVKAKINATYYFGAPVTDAKVKYTVKRSFYYHYYRRPMPYDWLYSDYYYGRFVPPYPRRDSGELIAEGELTTDMDGNAYVEFDTAKALKDYPDHDHLYAIDVEVTDPSRRTIEGHGTVKVTRNEFYAFLSVDRGFFSPGEKIEVEVNTVTPNDLPVATKGKMLVYRLEYTGGKNDKVKETEIYSEDFATGKTGRAFFKWQPDEEGKFKIRYRTVDSWDTIVTGDVTTWIAGKDFDGRRFKFDNLEIITDKRVYTQGEVAHVMINSNFDDSYVLLTQEAADEVLEVDVVAIPGRSKVIDVEIGEKHIPNFFFAGALVHDGNLTQAQTECFVPPDRKFLTIEIAPDKNEYLPGETGTFTVTATDYSGNPVQAELSLAVVDTSVFYIQPDIGPDVRTYFYGGRRYNNVRLSSYKEYNNNSSFKNTKEYKKYQTHGYPHGWWGRGEGERDYLGEAPAAAGGVMAEAAPSMMMRDGMEMAKSMDSSAEFELPAEQLVEAEVRKDFADTAFWSPVITTDENGEAQVELKYPDSLTKWEGKTILVTKDSEVGWAKTNVVTKKNLILRMQAPRFFVERDELVLSANVHNYLDHAKKVRVSLGITPADIELISDAVQNIEVDSNAEKRVDWRVKVMHAGTVKILMKALTDEESDAVEMQFPVLVHGAERFIARNGVLRDKTKATLTFNVPAERTTESTFIKIGLSPSIASCMIDAIPYLIDYPYGCIEQTMSRFLPAALVSKTLGDLGIKLEDIAGHKKQMDIDQLTSTMYPYLSRRNPVYSTAELQKVIDEGLKKIYTLQKSDGGWGWWSGDFSDNYMTSYVVFGLYTAKQAGYDVDAGVLARGFEFLVKNLKDEDSLHRKTYMTYVLALDKRVDIDTLNKIYDRRDDLNNYSKALLALAMYNLNDVERARVICRNLADFVIIDEENGTCHWENNDNYWWFWYNDPIETNAFILKAYVSIDPENKLNHMLVKWILNNRIGNRWRSSKDTANVIYALTDYLKAYNELNPDYTIKVTFAGKEKSFKVTRDNMFTFDNIVIFRGDAVRDGDNVITIEKEGEGTLYFTCDLTYFSLEEPIKGAGNEIFVTRKYYKLIPRIRNVMVGNVTQEKLTYDRQEIKDGFVLTSGDLIDVELEIEAKNNYEYLVFEDMKPAGCEPVALRSGYSYAGGLCSNMELRDEKVVFFITWLQQGKHTITYQVRAEIPGVFHALPTNSYAMYAPRVKATSDEVVLKIED